ncbi:hypothetical protein TNCV_2248051 [Trichonephila clavipes]|nr:hypothetical protein TNCV_2248051 [Trichonephila clavipes]
MQQMAHPWIEKLQDFLGLVQSVTHACIIRKLQTLNFYADFICTDVDATVKGAVHTLVTEFKSVTRVQQRVRTEWNVDPPSSKYIHQWDITLKDMGTFVFETGK